MLGEIFPVLTIELNNGGTLTISTTAYSQIMTYKSMAEMATYILKGMQANK